MSNAIQNDLQKERINMWNFWKSLNNSPGANETSPYAIDEVKKAYEHLLTAELMYQRGL